MALRPAMTTLITRLSRLINDPSFALFPQDELQDELDDPQVRGDVRGLLLDYAPEYVGGAVSFLDYYAPYGFWEEDAVLTDYSGTTISSSLYTPDYISGHWVFAASHTPPVFLRGQTYDLYRAAANLCERRATLTAEDFSFSTPHGSVSRGTKTTTWQALADRYRARARIGQITLTRNDVGGA